MSVRPTPLLQGGHGEGDQLKAALATTIATLDTEELQLARQLLHLVLAEQL